MSAINKKVYKWGKHHVYGELIASIFLGLLGFIYLLRGALRGDRGSIIMFIIFSVLSFSGFLHFLFLIIKASYIQIVDDGIHISPTFFIVRAKDIKWKDISKIKRIRRKKMTLSLMNKKDITINLYYLNKADRKSLIKIIKETIKYGFKQPPGEEDQESTPLASDVRQEMAASRPVSELAAQRITEPSLEAGVSPSGAIKRRRFKRFLPIVGACLLVVILGSVGWLLRDDIRKLLFLTMKCDRIEDTVDGYARYRHVETGAVIVDMEGTFFEALGLNAQNCPEYRHWRSDIVFVRLPGGTVAYGGKYGRMRDGRSEGTVGPYLIAKRPLVGSIREKAFKVALGRPFSAFVSDEGRINYGTLFDFAQGLGVSGWVPTIEQRLFALGSDWQPEKERTTQRASRNAPNEYGIVGLRHDPNIEPGFRLVHNLESSLSQDTAVVPTGLEGLASTSRRELDSAEDSEQLIHIQIIEQNWSGVAAGSRVYTKEGDPLRIRNDLASLTFSISVENASDTVLVVRPPVNLIGRSGQVIAETKLTGVQPKTREPLSNDGIEVPPRKTVILEFVSKLEEFDDFQAKKPLYIEFKRYGWRLNVKPLPSRQILYN